ncbi:MAG TPA: DUF222 domain-containing protein [Pseudonocardiaceae bacterium]|nr:DUF222 domain-containing protein [Pseudonocardiaceae bacterium]
MTVAVRDPVAAMSRGLDELRATLSGLDDKGVTHTLRDIEALSRTTQSVMLDVVAEAEARGIAVREGFGTTAGLVAAMLHLSGADARTRVEHAAMVGTRRTTTGETLAPKLPATSVENCCLLCPMHHQQVHLQGWDITIQGGRVEFLPPTIIDPYRRPLTNPLRR